MPVQVPEGEHCPLGVIPIGVSLVHQSSLTFRPFEPSAPNLMISYDTIICARLSACYKIQKPVVIETAYYLSLGGIHGMSDMVFWPGWRGDLSISLFALAQYGVTSHQLGSSQGQATSAGWFPERKSFIAANWRHPIIDACGSCWDSPRRPDHRPDGLLRERTRPARGIALASVVRTE